MRSIDRLLSDLNGDVLILRTEHVGPLRFTGIAKGDEAASLGERADFGLITHRRTLWFEEVGALVARADPPEIKQCDPLWAKKKYAPQGRLSYCQAACLVCSLASLAMWAGCMEEGETVEDFAREIGRVGAFEGDLLQHPDRVARTYPELVWHGREDRVFYSPRYDVHETSFVDWRERPADVELLAGLLEKQPVIVEVDYDPDDDDVDQHFVLAYKYLPDPTGGLDDDLLVMDPMTGLGSLLVPYFNPDWLGEWMRQNAVSRVARTLTGARIWEVKT